MPSLLFRSLIFCCFLLTGSVHGSWWKSAEEDVWREINLPQYVRTSAFVSEHLFLLRSQNVDLLARHSNGIYVRVDNNTIFLNQTIWILSTAKTIVSPDRAILDLANNTAMDAMIVAATQNPAGIEATRLDATCETSRLKAVSQPVVEMSNSDRLMFENLLRRNQTIIIRVAPNDLNVWIYLTNSAAFSVGIAINIFFTLLAIILAIRCLRRFLLKTGRSLSLPIVILSLLLFCNLARLAWLICHPLYYRGMLPIQISYWLLLIPWPFALCALLLWAMYWNELISRSRATPIVFLEKHKTLYIVCVTAVFLACFTLTFLSLAVGTYALVGLISIITACTIAIFILFMIVGVRVRSQIKLSMTGRRERLLQSTNLIILGGIFLFLFVISGAISYAVRVGVVWINLVAEWSIWFLLNASCTVQTLAFDPRGLGSAESSSETADGGSLLTKKSGSMLSSPSNSTITRSTKSMSAV